MREIVERSRTDGRGPGETTMRVWSARRLAAAVVVSGWAGLFWFLLASDRVSLYLSDRTSWVVPMAATLLTLTAAGVVVAARSPRPEPMGRREAAGMALLLVPVVVLLALPPTTLGSFSAPRKSQYTGQAFTTLFGRFDATSEITLFTVAAAKHTEEGARFLAERAGEQVRFVGFVTREDAAPSDELILGRFVVTCCAADATVVQVRVVNAPPGVAAPDDWVEVTGRIYPVGDEVIVDATSILPVDRPTRPYLSA
ncbi:MAG TPA: TIGR03943 family protein [Actinomycetota bacterium]